METRKLSPYKIKKDFNIFKENKLIPLVEGKRNFRAKTQSSLKRMLTAKSEYFNLYQMVMESKTNQMQFDKNRFFRKNINSLWLQNYDLHNHLINENNLSFTQNIENCNFYEQHLLKRSANMTKRSHTQSIQCQPIIESKNASSENKISKKMITFNFPEEGIERLRVFKNDYVIRQLHLSSNQLIDFGVPKMDVNHPCHFQDLKHFRNLVKLLTKVVFGQMFRLSEIRKLTILESKIF